MTGYRAAADDLHAIANQVRELQRTDAQTYAARDLIFIYAIERLATALADLEKRVQELER